MTKKLRILDLFSGIGGFSLGLERTGGFETVAFCEIEPFPRAVLRKQWPDVPQYEDVRTLTADQLVRDGIGRVDVITGGFPCQDLSNAGKKAGMADGTRSGLWSEIIRLAGELRPNYIILENVAALLSGPSDRRGGWFGRVLGDLAENGFDAWWGSIPASSVRAKHPRDRVWIVAHRPGDIGDVGEIIEHYIAREMELAFGGGGRVLPDTSSVGQSEQRQSFYAVSSKADGQREADELEYGCVGGVWSVEPDVGRVANGVPDSVDRLTSLGNAVVPQIPEIIGRAILQSRS